MSAPALSALPFESWMVSPPLLGESLLVAALYLAATRRTSRWPLPRTAAFLAGLLVIQVALESGIDFYDERLLSVHMVQHVLLIEVAPALLLYGRPLHLALRTLPASERRALGRGLIASRRWATPPVCLCAFALVVCGTHIPIVYDATVRNQALHDAEHAAYVLAGLAMWWPLHGDPAPSHRLGAIGQLLYISAAMLPMALIGAYLNRDPTLFYSVYAEPARALGVSAVQNQQEAGAIMWVAGTTLMALTGLASVLSSMLAAERRQRARELHEVVR